MFTFPSSPRFLFFPTNSSPFSQPSRFIYLKKDCKSRFFTFSSLLKGFFVRQNNTITLHSYTISYLTLNLTVSNESLNNFRESYIYRIAINIIYFAKKKISFSNFNSLYYQLEMQFIYFYCATSSFLEVKF